jgi:hypothetical protein
MPIPDQLVRKGNGAHNLEFTEELLGEGNNRFDKAIKQLSKKK